ncbi:hypothetical protein C8J56DRAFT_1061877 [Mycena floridula]|nr:hypothetical protein C8J56DRAFT_1061877 [Mycena floridula]
MVLLQREAMSTDKKGYAPMTKHGLAKREIDSGNRKLRLYSLDPGDEEPSKSAAVGR